MCYLRYNIIPTIVIDDVNSRDMSRYIVIENLEGKLATNRLFSGKLKLAFKIYFVATLNFLAERE